jgi:multidrug efflux pump subunit AcrA (membrane-fusion protein)
MKTAFAIMLITVLGGGGALLLQHNSGSDHQSGVPEGMLYKAKRGKLIVTITENGSLSAKDSQKITFDANRGGTIAFLVEEGKTVEKDEVLCKLETTELEAELQELKLNIVKTEADLDTAKTELEIQQSDNGAADEKARIALTKSENELKCYRDGTAPKERRTFEVAIKEALTTHSRAKKKHEDSVKLLDQNYVNKSQVEQDEIDFERSEIQLTGANRDLEIFDEYTYPMAMTDKIAAVADAARDLENGAKRAKSKLRQMEVSVESQDSRLAQLKKKLDEVEETIAVFTITAPGPGIVIYGDPEVGWYRHRVKIGGHVWGGFSLFTIPDLRVMKVQVEIHEADINKIKTEQKASVTMDTYPGLILKGEITKIATIAGNPDRNGNDEVKKFNVDITMESTEELNLKPGISAKAEIFIEQRDNVLYVPMQSVFFEEGKHYCFVKRDLPTPARVEVKPDLNNDSYVQIVDGLKEGDSVLLYNPVLRQATEVLTTSEETQPAPEIPASHVKVTRAD